MNNWFAKYSGFKVISVKFPLVASSKIKKNKIRKFYRCSALDKDMNKSEHYKCDNKMFQNSKKNKGFYPV